MDLYIYRGPGEDTSTLISNPEYFDILFPQVIPKNIKSQVWNIITTLYKLSIFLCDIHTGNFVVKDGIVKVIDLEQIL